MKERYLNAKKELNLFYFKKHFYPFFFVHLAKLGYFY